MSVSADGVSFAFNPWAGSRLLRSYCEEFRIVFSPKQVGSAVFVIVAVSMLGTMSPAGAVSKPRPLEILVSNDDGVGAPGITALADALKKLPNVHITVSAPLTNQSGVGGKTSPGYPTGGLALMRNGDRATAVNGYPADSVIYALQHLYKKRKPDVVVTGANLGQNLGANTDASGTVGAARAAAQRGIPALAVSADLASPDYATAAKLAADWVTEHRNELTTPKKAGSAVLLQSLNVPTCPGGNIRGIAETTVSPSSDHALDSADCASTLPQPTDDITAYTNGFASLSTPSLTPAT
jgi:5'-nucleotidase